MSPDFFDENLTAGEQNREVGHTPRNPNQANGLFRTIVATSIIYLGAVGITDIFSEDKQANDAVLRRDKSGEIYLPEAEAGGSYMSFEEFQSTETVSQETVELSHDTALKLSVGQGLCTG